MEQELIREPDALSPEIWFRVFQFLDVPSLLTAQRVCTSFYQLCNLDSIWRRKCYQHFSRVENDFYIQMDKPADVDDSNSIHERVTKYSNWKELYKSLAHLHIEGTYNTHSVITFDSNIIENSSIYKLVSAFPAESESGLASYVNQFIHGTKSCKRIVGEGEAPWGSFEIVGCNLGPFFAFTHIYWGHNFFTCTLHEMTPQGVLTGCWKTNWQSATGVSVLAKSNHPDMKTIVYRHIVDQSNLALQREKEATLLVGQWEGRFHIDGENATSFSMDFCIPKLFDEEKNTVLGGFTGHLSSQNYMNPWDASLVLGSIFKDMVGMSIVIGDSKAMQHDYLTLVGQVTGVKKQLKNSQKDERKIDEFSDESEIEIETKYESIHKIEGKFVSTKEGITGSFVAIKKPPQPKDKRKHQE